jgi:ankyrin repeat protein
MLLNNSKDCDAGVPEDFSVSCRHNEDSSLLVISRSAIDNIFISYPEQNDIIMTNLLFQFGLTRDGQDTARGTRPNQQSDDEAYLQLRESIKRELRRSVDKAMGELTFAASTGELETVRVLLARGLPIDQGDYDNRTTLHLAVAEGQLAIVKLLIAKGANVDVADRWGSTPLAEALKGNKFSIAELLIANGAKMPANSFSIVKEAAENDGSKLNIMCSQGGADINSCDYDMRSVLHACCAGQNLQGVETLLAHGANVHVKDRCVVSNVIN